MSPEIREFLWLLVRTPTTAAPRRRCRWYGVLTTSWTYPSRWLGVLTTSGRFRWLLVGTPTTASPMGEMPRVWCLHPQREISVVVGGDTNNGCAGGYYSFFQSRMTTLHSTPFGSVYSWTVVKPIFLWAFMERRFLVAISEIAKSYLSLKRAL